MKRYQIIDRLNIKNLSLLPYPGNNINLQPKTIKKGGYNKMSKTNNITVRFYTEKTAASSKNRIGKFISDEPPPPLIGLDSYCRHKHFYMRRRA